MSSTLGLAPHIDNDVLISQTKARLETLRSEFAGNTLRGGKLKNQVCIVTGVGSLRGIGRATAILYAHEGAKHLYLLDFDGTNLPELKQTIEKSYPDVKVSTLQADASDDATIKGLCESALQEEGRLDVFFANAGIATHHYLSEISQESFMDVVKINTLSCFLALKYASAAMSQVNASCGKEYTGGSIIMTASVAGIRSGGGPVDYSASKAAINSLAQTGAYQLQRTGIRVNTICPGLIETNMTTGIFERAKANSETGVSAMGRHAIPEEIARVAMFLACDDSSYINGQNIAVDGGLSATLPVLPGRWV